MTALLKTKLNSGDPQNQWGTDAASDGSDDSSDVGASQAAALLTMAPATTEQAVTFAGSGMVFDNTYGSGVSDAFKSAITAAENFFQSQFSNPVTISVSFDRSALSGQFSAYNTYYPVHGVSYAALEDALASHTTTADDRAAVASLPSVDPTGGAGFSVPVGMARILGLAGAGSGIDDYITLNQNLPWTYGADAVGALEHEISEGVMGRVGGLGVQNSSWGPMDLFRYAAPGQHDYSGGQDGAPSFFSVDGTTLLTQFHNSLNTSGVFDGQDFADWNSTQGDAFGPGGPGSPGTVSATDLRVMDILGWTPTATVPPPPVNFTILDTTTDTTTTSAGDSYTGPVAGLDYQCIDINPDSLNITSSVPNAFIHSGAGMDGINVSAANGNNILDGATNSNFLIGGTGNDTFYMDDRNPTSPIFSTIVNFHGGDNATVWGVNPTDFKLITMDNQGAAGARGLDYIFTAPGHIDTSFVLAGYSTADLTNGRLTASYGRTPDLPNLPGSEYLTVHAT